MKTEVKVPVVGYLASSSHCPISQWFNSRLVHQPAAETFHIGPIYSGIFWKMACSSEAITKSERGCRLPSL